MQGHDFRFFGAFIFRTCAETLLSLSFFAVYGNPYHISFTDKNFICKYSNTTKKLLIPHSRFRRGSGDGNMLVLMLFHISNTPPSTTICVPVMYEDISDARNNATLPISSGSPSRCIGIFARKLSIVLSMSIPAP